ncbi:MAG: tRNA CCA-pyrophosphorylase [Euryarchaeota archaeon]|nr:tRNA CCA-pyrophosphorylase [Euryarchaeota archaeon]
MSLRVIINTARTPEQGEVVKGGRKLEEVYRAKAAVCFMHPEDAAEIGVGEGDSVLVRTEEGEVVVAARLSDGIQRGTVMLPLSPWVNRIISSRTYCTGSPRYKGMRGVVERSEQPVAGVEELMGMYLKGCRR